MYKEYWKKELNNSCQSLYDRMVVEFAALRELVNCDSFSADDISKVYMAVYNDHPEFFYLPHNPQLQKKVGALFFSSSTLVAKFIYSQQQIFDFREKISKIKHSFLTKKENGESEIMLERQIVDYCIENFSYAIDNVYNQNASALLINKTGQCSGISKAVKLLLETVSIPCIVVSGTSLDQQNGRQEAHAWNIIYLNGRSVHLDVTMMMGSNTSKTRPFRYTHFNISDKSIGKTHQWDTKRLPECFVDMDMPAGNNQKESEVQYKVISSLAEFRVHFKKEVELRKQDVAIRNLISGYTKEGLLRLYCSACQSVLTQLNIGASYQISISGDYVSINIKF